ncbi:MAG: nuclear transport factor 2 family protein [Pyrinomonadaceae bacterium]
MKKLILMIMTLITASFLLISCGGPAANNSANAGNKAANTATAPAADAAAIETEIKKLANEGVAAVTKGDTTALDKLWGDNYVFVGQDGAVSTKAQRIESMKSGQSKIESLAYDEMSVRSNPDGTGAVLIGRATVKGTNMGKSVDGQMRFTQVWSKTKDGWRLVSGQVTPIAAAAAKADDKKADEKADDKMADDKKVAPPLANANR